MKPGQFVWYDVMTTDVPAAQSFYEQVVGWQGKDSGMEGPKYILFNAGPAMVGGLMPIPDDAKAMGAGPCWTGYIAVADVDASADRAKQLGGMVHRAPADIPGVGRFSVVADPHGAVFILFKGQGEAPPAPADGTPGTVGWHELYAGDADSDFAFYVEMFGWMKLDAMDMGAMGKYQMFSTGAGPAGGIMNKMPQMPVPFWLYYFNVDAIDAAGARVKNAGGKIINGPMEVPGGSWIVQCMDPQGAMFALVAPKK